MRAVIDQLHPLFTLSQVKSFMFVHLPPCLNTGLFLYVLYTRHEQQSSESYRGEWRNGAPVTVRAALTGQLPKR